MPAAPRAVPPPPWKTHRFREPACASSSRSTLVPDLRSSGVGNNSPGWPKIAAKMARIFCWGSGASPSRVSVSPIARWRSPKHRRRKRVSVASRQATPQFLSNPPPHDELVKPKQSPLLLPRRRAPQAFLLTRRARKEIPQAHFKTPGAGPRLVRRPTQMSRLSNHLASPRRAAP